MHKIGSEDIELAGAIDGAMAHLEPIAAELEAKLNSAKDRVAVLEAQLLSLRGALSALNGEKVAPALKRAGRRRHQRRSHTIKDMVIAALQKGPAKIALIQARISDMFGYQISKPTIGARLTGLKKREVVSHEGGVFALR